MPVTMLMPSPTRLLDSRECNTFEQRVLTAFQWAGRATADDRREEAILLYLIALESLLLGEDVDRELRPPAATSPDWSARTLRREHAARLHQG